MKRIIAIAIMVVGMTAFAQEGKSRGERTEKEQFTTEQKNQLRLKKLILLLDLTPSQQKEMGSIIADQAIKKESMRKERKANKAAHKKFTADEKFAMANKILDEKIETKARIKKVLTAEQFAKWEKMKEKGRKKMNGKKRHHKPNVDLPKE